MPIAAELISIVAKSAPLLAGALGSPIAGIAISLLENYFGVKSEQLTNILQTDPDAATKLKALEFQHSEELTKLASNNYQIAVDDRKSARERNEEIIKSGKSDVILSALAILVVLSFFILCIMNYFYPIRDDHVLIMLLGQLTSGFIMVLSFYFGSSNK